MTHAHLPAATGPATNWAMTAPAILQVIPALETGGAERTTVQIAEALMAAGGRAVVASAGGRLVAPLERLGARHVTMPLGSKNPGVMAANVARLIALIRREDIDLVHARSRAPAWSAFAAARLTGKPFVTTYHGIYNEKMKIKRLYNSVMARGDRVIANSHYTARLMAERYGLGEAQIDVVYRGTDIEMFAAEAVDKRRTDALRADWGVGDDRPIVLQLARLTGWKGQATLIEAAARLADETPALFILAGDDQGRQSYRRELEALIARHKLEGRVRLVGHCVDVPAAMNLADAVVVASRRPEAFGRAAVEAQAAGRPVIVSDLGAVPETVLAPPDVDRDARTGWRFPPGDADALAESLREALTLAPAERDALSRRARHHSAKFSGDAMKLGTLAIYDACLRGIEVDRLVARCELDIG